MITGWIKLRRLEDDALVYVSVDNIQSVYEVVDPDEGNNGDGIATYSVHSVLNMITGRIEVIESLAEVMREIKLARPVRS